MAGEWIAYDLALPDKPEVQELIDLTGEPVEAVVFNLLRLWGWASMHCADGTARMTLPRLVRTCGADEAFWRAVAAVGWLEVDEEGAAVAVPGWDRRFSQAAKSRIQARDREKAYEERSERPSQRERGKQPGRARGDQPAPERGRGEERRIDIPPPPPRDASQDQAALRAAWAAAAKAGKVQPYRAKTVPPALADRLAEPGWLDEALQAIEHLPRCRYFDTPATLFQLVGAGFVQRVLAHQYDDPKPAKAGRGPAHLEDRPPPRGWSGDDAARLEATRKAMATKLAKEVA
jgi:hypothetical protein